MRIKASVLIPLAACGVYIWWRKDTPLYVGMSTNMLARIGRHHVIGVVETLEKQDEIEFRKCADEEAARELESQLIRQWSPRLNKSINPAWLNKKRSEKDVIFSLRAEERDRKYAELIEARALRLKSQEAVDEAYQFTVSETSAA